VSEAGRQDGTRAARPRPPAVAGAFYPAEREQLGRLVDALFAAAAELPRPTGLEPDAVLGLLVPHAGLIYSGAIAAAGWALAGQAEPATIVLAGTDHQAWADGVGVWTGGPWQTPAGDVAADADLASHIAALGPPYAADNSAHLAEHSLEVQLPLLAHVCPQARIVALAVSPRLTGHAEAGTALGRLLAELRAGGQRILLVVSSDFAHYPPADVCAAATAELMEPIARLDGEGLAVVETKMVASRRPGLVCGMCGIDPARFSLAALAQMGASRGLLLGAATSADAGGDRRRTVGYAAVAFV
jgi:AmmeMemoRadiSam system protein B